MFRPVVVDYIGIFIFLCTAVILAFILLGLSYLVSSKSPDFEKVSPYECGFEPFSADSRGNFDSHFYIVGILFMIFDLEIAYIFPWAACMKEVGGVHTLFMLLFLYILTAGFVYEWARGALDWSKGQEVSV